MIAFHPSWPVHFAHLSLAELHKFPTNIVTLGRCSTEGQHPPYCSAVSGGISKASKARSYSACKSVNFCTYVNRISRLTCCCAHFALRPKYKKVGTLSTAACDFIKNRSICSAVRKPEPGAINRNKNVLDGCPVT